MTPVIEIENLHYWYRSDFLVKRFDALRGIDLSVSEGECFGFVGHNGAGKTTTIKCLLNLVQPKRGAVRLFGMPSTKTNARAAVGYLPEQPYFYDHLTVREMLEFYAVLAGVEAREITSRIDSLTERLGLGEKRAARMRSLSKGLMQRVAMAQAIVAAPKLLILDEPFSGLDPLGRKEFRDLIAELKSQGTTIFMSSHVLSDVEMICDRVSIAVKGALKGIYATREIPGLTGGHYEIVLDILTPDALRDLQIETERQGQSTTLRFNNRDEALRMLRHCLEKGYAVEKYEFEHGDLEDLFIHVTSAQ